MNNNQTYRPEAIDTVIDAEYEVITEPRGIRAWFAPPRPTSTKQAMEVVRQDRLMAMLSKNALLTIGDLSLMENHVNAVAPHNAELCRVVLESYTHQAAAKIRGC